MDEPKANDPQQGREDTQPDDVEGHVLPIVIGVNQAARNRRPARPEQEEELRPLTKPFPRLRDETKRS